MLRNTEQGQDDFSDCLYYYGRNQPLLASSHCEAAIPKNENSYTAWSNAGYAELDNGDFKTALTLRKGWCSFLTLPKRSILVRSS